MHGHLNLWKATIAVVLYVAVCMLILCFSPPDYAQDAPTQSGSTVSGALVDSLTQSSD